MNKDPNFNSSTIRVLGTGRGNWGPLFSLLDLGVFSELPKKCLVFVNSIDELGKLKRLASFFYYVFTP